MFDVSWSHLALIAVIALVVIGPKDLPRVLRTVGVWVGRARAVARDFQGSIDQMIREAELDEVRKQVETATSVNLEHEIEKTIDPTGEMKQSLSEPVLSDPVKPLEPSGAPAPAESTTLPASAENATPPAPAENAAPPAADAETATKSSTHA